MHSKEVIGALIHEAVKTVTGIDLLDDDSCLVDRTLGIHPADIIYIFEIIEERLKLPIHSIFINNNSEVMIIKNLINALSELTPS
jgi:hypothetical protein